MKEQNRTPEKEINKMEISNLSDAEFKTLVIRMLKQLIGYFNSIKKTKAEIKLTLNEIKMYRESTMKWMKPRIKSMMWSTRKKKIQSEQQEEKRIQKK